MTQAYNPPKIETTGVQEQPRPVWKRIGEASNDLVMWIEQIDGFRIPVTRYMGMPDLRPLPQTTVADYENQERTQRDIIREAYRSAMEFADTKAAMELRERLARAEDDIRRNEARIKQEASRLYPGVHTDMSPLNFRPF